VWADRHLWRPDGGRFSELRFITTLLKHEAELFLVTNRNGKTFHANVHIKDMTEMKRRRIRRRIRAKTRKIRKRTRRNLASPPSWIVFLICGVLCQDVGPGTGYLTDLIVTFNRYAR
jgi:hypothetical protein